MSIYNSIRKFFGFSDNADNAINRYGFNDNEHPNKFRKPIWNYEDDEDDDDDLDFRSQTPFGFKVFSNPVEIHRFFEHQMNEMFKMFQGLERPSMFPQDGRMFKDDGHTFSNYGGFSFGMPSLPVPFTPGDSEIADSKQGTDRSLRDYYLKPGYDPKPGQQTQQDRQDSDLDDKVKSGELTSILETLPSSDPLPDVHRKPRWYRSVVTFSTTRPDGTVEERRTVDNGNGKEETVTRRIGDKSYSVTTATDSNGVQTQTERFINLNEDALNDFKEDWRTRDAPEHHSDPFTWFSFNKLFK